MLAARTGSVDVVSALIAAGADVNAREAWREQTALMWAAEGAFPELVDLLIEHGADVRARAAANDWGTQITSEPRAQYRPTGGLTPLLYAARSGCAECVRAILAAGEARRPADARRRHGADARHRQLRVRYREGAARRWARTRTSRIGGAARRCISPST